jgi:hypothetical protein
VLLNEAELGVAVTGTTVVGELLHNEAVLKLIVDENRTVCSYELYEYAEIESQSNDLIHRKRISRMKFLHGKDQTSF